MNMFLYRMVQAHAQSTYLTTPQYAAYMHIHPVLFLLTYNSGKPHAMAIQTMLALAAAIVVGMLMKTFVPDTVNTVLNDNIFSSISTMFLNALKMIVGPVVFFIFSSPEIRSLHQS